MKRVARSRLQRVAAGADGTADSGAIGSAGRAGNRAQLERALASLRSAAQQAQRSAEDHDVRLRSRRDDEPGSDRRAASGARRGYSGRGRGTRGATGPARSAHRAGAVPAVALHVSPQRRRDAEFSFEKNLCVSRLCGRDMDQSVRGRRSTRTRSPACS